MSHVEPNKAKLFYISFCGELYVDLPYYSAIKITCITVRAEVIENINNALAYVVPAMKNALTALRKVGLYKKNKGIKHAFLRGFVQIVPTFYWGFQLQLMQWRRCDSVSVPYRKAILSSPPVQKSTSMFRTE